MKLILLFIGYVAAESCVMKLNIGGIACEATKSVSCSTLIAVDKNLESSFHITPSCTRGRDGISCTINSRASKAEIRNWFTTHKWTNKCCLSAGESHCL